MRRPRLSWARQRWRKLTLWVLLGAAGASGSPLAAQAIRLLKPKPHPNSLLGDTTIALYSTPTSVSFTLVANSTATASAAIAITSTVTLPLSTSINVYGYFASATAGLTGNVSGANIPTSAIYGIVPTGVPTTYTAFTQTGPFGAASASLKLVALSGITILHIETDNLTLKINLSGVAVPADTYVGTLYIQGQAF